MCLDKSCERCGRTYRPHRRSQRWCSLRCRGAAMMHATPSKAAARKRAQKAIPLGPCVKCGSTISVQRQHRDHSKPLDVVLLWKWGVRPALDAAYQRGWKDALAFVVGWSDCACSATEWFQPKPPRHGKSSGTGSPRQLKLPGTEAA
jgi:hypothetical protein